MGVNEITKTIYNIREYDKDEYNQYRFTTRYSTLNKYT